MTMSEQARHCSFGLTKTFFDLSSMVRVIELENSELKNSLTEKLNLLVADNTLQRLFHSFFFRAQRNAYIAFAVATKDKSWGNKHAVLVK